MTQQQTFGFAALPNYTRGIPAPPVNPLPARTTDPVSSSEAAVEMIESGKMATQRMEVFAAFKRHGPATTLELSQATGMDRHMLAKRAPELERMKLLVRGPVRLCKVGNRNATEWSAK